MPYNSNATNDERNAINLRLKEIILGRAKNAGSFPTDVAGFNLVRRETANEVRVFYKPFVGLTVQGRKRSVIGGGEYTYGEYHCFVAGIDMPSESWITGASETEPFLALSLDLDRSLVARIVSEMAAPGLSADVDCASGSRTTGSQAKSVAVMEADVPLMRAFLRLAELLDEPQDIPVMAPLLIKEIHYRLLAGAQGAWLKAICSVGSAENRIASAVTWIRENFKEPMNVGQLAKNVGMSPSRFFRNFKSLTGSSPLQFQKMLRLYEAQRLLLSGECDVAGAAYGVGYESPPQFIREYKRLFGQSPRRDTEQKRSSLR